MWKWALGPHHSPEQRVLCAKFGWNFQRRFLKNCQLILTTNSFSSPLASSQCQGSWDHSWPWDTSGLRTPDVVRMLPWRKAWLSIWKKKYLKSQVPIMVEISPMVLESKLKIKKITDRQTDGQKTLIRKTHLNFQLRWAKIVYSLIECPKKLITFWCE